MKILISPAKSLDYESALPIEDYTQPNFLKQAEELNTRLKEMSKKEIAALMKISDKLTELNYERFHDFHLPFTPANARPAIFAFSGDVYVGLDAYTLEQDKFAVLQEKLRILSGLYGILKPLDLMQPYRLEMGTKLNIGIAKNLYEYWGNHLTDFLNQEMKEGEYIINLASNEYFKSIQPKRLKSKLITPVFKDYKNGEFKIIAFHAKKARGSMVRFIIENNITNLEGIQTFNTGGYAYSEKETLDENNPVFTR